MTRDIDQVMLDRRDVMKGTAAAAGALLLPGGAIAQGTPRKGGILRVAMPYNPGSVDPMTGRNLTDFNVLYGVFDALIDFEPHTLELKPGLAKSWKFTDPKTLVLDLVDGVKFHDGTPFNAEAVKFNLERYKNDQRSNVKADLGTVDSVEVTGPNQVTLKLNKPNVGLPTILTNRVGLMVSPKSIQDKGPQRRPQSGRHRSVQVRELAGQRQFRAHAQRELLEAGPAVSRRHQHRDHQRAQHRGARGGRRRDRSWRSTCSRRRRWSPIARPTWSTKRVPVARALRRLPQLRHAAARRRARAPGAQLRDQPRRDQQDRRGSASASRRARSCRRSTGPAIRRRRTSTHYDPDKAKKLLAEAGHPDGIEIETYRLGRPDSRCSGRKSSSRSSPRSASASS